jgi:hypothetical protein
MAKRKVSRPLVYGAVAVVAVAGFLLTQEQAPERKGAPRRQRAVQQSTASSGFTEADRTAKFARVSSDYKDVFVPLVRRAEPIDAARRPNELPLGVTGGKSPWIFTGTAVIDQVPRALVENAATGETLFVTVGDRVGAGRVAQVGPGFLVVAGPSGALARAELLGPEDWGEDFLDPVSSFAPVEPSLSGPIAGTRNVSGAQARSSNQETPIDASLSE